MARVIKQWQEGDKPPDERLGSALIGKAFRLLGEIAQSPNGTTPSDLAKVTGWSRPTVYRILHALAAYGFARLDTGTGNYTLGYQFLELAQRAWSNSDLAAIANAELLRLRDLTGETTYLSVRNGTTMLSIGRFEGLHPVRSAAQLGVRKPLHCTAQGKAFLAFLTVSERKRLVRKMEFEKYTSDTIVEPDALETQLAVVRQRGYAVDDEEILAGIGCVGAPILDPSGTPVASFSVAGPIWRLTPERIEQLGPEVASVARSISRALPRTWPSSGRGHGGVGPLESHPSPAFWGADPQWDSGGRALRWVDRLGPTIHVTNTTRSIERKPELEAAIDAAAFVGDDALISIEGRVLRIDPEGREIEEASSEEGRVVGLATDPYGHVWASRASEGGSRIAPLNGSSESGWSVAATVTALAWSPRGDLLFAGSPEKGAVHLCRRGEPARLLTRIPPVSGRPVGLGVDSGGRLWVALFDGWSIARLGEEGDIDLVVALPVPRPTGLAFAGSEERSIYVTTARHGLSHSVLNHAPLSGRLLAVSLPRST